MRKIGWPLIMAGWGLMAGAAVHIAALAAGPRWMAVLGAPPPVVMSSMQGTWLAPVSTMAIAALLVILALYCLSAAGRFARLRAAVPVLVIFATILVARGLLVVPFLLWGQREWTTPIGHFVAISPLFALGSLIVLVIGGLILAGLSVRSAAQN